MVFGKWFSKDVQLIDINKYLEKIKNEPFFSISAINVFKFIVA